MPLTRDRITAASRVMLPAHIAMSTLLGAGWAFQDQRRTNVPSLQIVRGAWPIPNTGYVLIGLGALAMVGVLSHRRALAAIGLAAAALAYLALGVLAVVALHPQVRAAWEWGHWLTVTPGSPDASLTAPLWPFYLVTAHLASVLSLARDEYTDAAGNHYGRTP